jgi:hypothetical protein
MADNLQLAHRSIRQANPVAAYLEETAPIHDAAVDLAGIGGLQPRLLGTARYESVPSIAEDFPKVKA